MTKERILPPPFWFYWSPGRWYWSWSWAPIHKGSDEWGRHTLCIGLPLIGGIVIPTKWCDCEDTAEFRCTWPGCPALSITPDEPCPIHDPEWLVDVA